MGLTVSLNERAPRRAPEPVCVSIIAPAVERAVPPRRHRSPPRPAFVMPSEGRRAEEQRLLVSFWRQARFARPKAQPRRGRFWRSGHEGVPGLFAVISVGRATNATKRKRRKSCTEIQRAPAKRALAATHATYSQATTTGAFTITAKRASLKAEKIECH